MAVLSDAAVACNMSLTLLSCAPAFRSASSSCSATVALLLDAHACGQNACFLANWLTAVVDEAQKTRNQYTLTCHSTVALGGFGMEIGTTLVHASRKFVVA